MRQISASSRKPQVGVSLEATVGHHLWLVSATSYATTVKDIDPQAAMLAAVVANLVTPRRT